MEDEDMMSACQHSLHEGHTALLQGFSLPSEFVTYVHLFLTYSTGSLFLSHASRSRTGSNWMCMYKICVYNAIIVHESIYMCREVE